MPSATYQQGALQSWDAQVVYNSQPPFQKVCFYFKCPSLVLDYVYELKIHFF